MPWKVSFITLLQSTLRLNEFKIPKLKLNFKQIKKYFSYKTEKTILKVIFGPYHVYKIIKEKEKSHFHFRQFSFLNISHLSVLCYMFLTSQFSILNFSAGLWWPVPCLPGGAVLPQAAGEEGGRKGAQVGWAG